MNQFLSATQNTTPAINTADRFAAMEQKLKNPAAQVWQPSDVKVWLNRWLRDNLRGQNAEHGDMIALRFDGKKTTTKGQSFNSYHLIVDKG